MAGTSRGARVQLRGAVVGSARWWPATVQHGFFPFETQMVTGR
jgi:hypothetical protein